jgi:hypothetical protein
VLTWIIYAAANGLGAGRIGLTSTLIALAIFLLVSVLASAQLARLSRKGRYVSLWQAIGERIMNRNAAALRDLAAGGTIEWHGLAAHDGRLQLVLLTPSRLLIVTLSGTARQVRSMQQVVRAATSDIARCSIEPSWARRLIGALPQFGVRFNVGNNACELRFFDPQSADDFARAMAATTRSADMNLSEGEGASQTTYRADPSVPVWGQLLLAALFPGLGQLSQDRLLFGILYLTAFAANVIGFMRPAVAYLHRTMDVSPRVFVAAGVTLGLIWLVAWLDTYLYARHNRQR